MIELVSESRSIECNICVQVYPTNIFAKYEMYLRQLPDKGITITARKSFMDITKYAYYNAFF
jgi:hypothetical protein